jgi:hypothetical protein
MTGGVRAATGPRSVISTSNALGGEGMASINYERNRRYFEPVSYKPGVICIVIGVIALLFASVGPVLVGLVLIGLGSFLIYRQVADRPSDAEIDRQMREIIGEIPPVALQRLGLEADEVGLIKPVLVGGNKFDSSTMVKRGKDGILRSSSCEGVVIFFGDQELHAFKAGASLVREENGEQTDVYFYRDVVSVSTASETMRVPVVGRPEVTLEQFKLTTSGGTSITCSMSATGSTKEQDIQGARQLIRKKKLQLN